MEECKDSHTCCAEGSFYSIVYENCVECSRECPTEKQHTPECEENCQKSTTLQPTIAAQSRDNNELRPVSLPYMYIAIATIVFIIILMIICICCMHFRMRKIIRVKTKESRNISKVARTSHRVEDVESLENGHNTPLLQASFAANILQQECEVISSAAKKPSKHSEGTDLSSNASSLSSESKSSQYSDHTLAKVSVFIQTSSPNLCACDIALAEKKPDYMRMNEGNLQQHNKCDIKESNDKKTSYVLPSNGDKLSQSTLEMINPSNGEKILHTADKPHNKKFLNFAQSSKTDKVLSVDRPQADMDKLLSVNRPLAHNQHMDNASYDRTEPQACEMSPFVNFQQSDISRQELHSKDQPRDGTQPRSVDQPRDGKELRSVDQPCDSTQLRSVDQPRDDKNLRSVAQPPDGTELRSMDQSDVETVSPSTDPSHDNELYSHSDKVTYPFQISHGNTMITTKKNTKISSVAGRTGQIKLSLQETAHANGLNISEDSKKESLLNDAATSFEIGQQKMVGSTTYMEDSRTESIENDVTMLKMKQSLLCSDNSVIQIRNNDSQDDYSSDDTSVKLCPGQNITVNQGKLNAVQEEQLYSASRIKALDSGYDTGEGAGHVVHTEHATEAEHVHSLRSEKGQIVSQPMGNLPMVGGRAKYESMGAMGNNAVRTYKQPDSSIENITSPLIYEAQQRNWTKVQHTFKRFRNQPNRPIYDAIKKLPFVEGFYSAGDSIEVYVNLDRKDKHLALAELVHVSGALPTKFHISNAKFA